MTVDEVCRSHRRIAFDANVFIYLFEGEGDLARAAASVLDAISDGRATGLAATIALSEVMVGPVRAGEEMMAERYVDAIRSIEHLDLVPATVEIAAEAGLIRGGRGLTLADALHVATARAGGASVLVTNDRRIRPMPNLAVVQLADLIA
ncbi:MAG TPA: type II toxin-antitoxin system VapC family toxin [Patescibacteria group bacterium]|nr:type II toxin-antitoxin system VapC family toxin [Patescibacteria group bacterium]